MLTSLFMALVWSPEATNLTAPAERYAQRIFYFHVPAAWIGFLAFMVAATTSVLYLITRREKWDVWSLASVEIGLAFFTMVMLSGPIWAKPTWNVWWTWDPRLTISTICWLLYIGYLMLRGAVDHHPERQARFAAVFALLASLSIPANWMAIRWWRTIHPAVVMPGPNAGAMGNFGMSANIQIDLTKTLKRICAGQSGEDYQDLLYVRRHYLTKDQLRSAIIDVVNALFRTRLTEIWGEGTTACASDSKKFSAWDQNLLTEWHIRYRGPGIMVYWHVDRKAACIYSQVKSCSSSEVAAMIEGVLRQLHRDGSRSPICL